MNWKPILLVLSLFAAAAVGVAIGKAAQPVTESLGAPRDLQCLPDSNLCVGEALAKGSLDYDSDLTFRAVTCQPKGPYADKIIFAPRFAFERCEAGIAGLSFTSGQRHFLAKVENERIVGVRETGDAGWAP